MDFSDIPKVSLEKESGGVWCEWKDTSGRALPVKIAAVGSPKFITATQRHFDPENGFIDSPENRRAATVACLAEAIITDWGMTNGGEPMPYTPALGLEFMTERGKYGRDFADWVAKESYSQANYRAEAVGALATESKSDAPVATEARGESQGLRADDRARRTRRG